MSCHLTRYHPPDHWARVTLNAIPSTRSLGASCHLTRYHPPDHWARVTLNAIPSTRSLGASCHLTRYHPPDHWARVAAFRGSSYPHSPSTDDQENTASVR
ncbi:hypothetical protein BgiBS90_012989 [Biomphalaria glabrata]|nr:hypothetical protein BgiBS90_012989 [Biomphalaria glabrata]